ncbi:inositol monophosphatase [Candidatus Peregrinibacteria bacterium]|nr:inositol monophosphatase [Candidatus Peregrinibacteria bacterium]
MVEKGVNDLVTNADKASEKFIIENINKTYPDHGILAEESSFNQTKSYGEKFAREARSHYLIGNPNGTGAFMKEFANKKYIWLIDPLDGTTNFAHGLPLYAVSIGLFGTKSIKKSKNFEYLSGELILGVVFAPELNELFYAQKGHGAFLNGKKIKVSNVKSVKNSLFVTGFPTTHKEINIPYFEKITFESQALRRLGAAALDLCYIACGRFDGYWEFGLKPWDIAAGSLIVSEAGGQVTDIYGNELDLFGSDIFASNKKIHKETVEIFKKI